MRIRKQEKQTAFQRYCIENGYTASMIAEKLGISKYTVYSYFRHERLPSRKTMKVMEEKLGINPHKMFNN